MKTAIMQPYLFPYIGYWQLISAVEQFVILDDVNFIKRGYINRNNILINGKAYTYSVPIKSASQNRLIMDTKLSFDKKERKRFLSRIDNSYRKAPQFDVIMPILEKIIGNETNSLTEFIKYSMEKIMVYLGINTTVFKSSEIDKDNSLSAQNRIIEICKCLNTDIYINSSGGRTLYQSDYFLKQGIELLFLDTRSERIVYHQFNDEFVENLSIIDILMFNAVEKIQVFLKEYDLNK